MGSHTRFGVWPVQRGRLWRRLLPLLPLLFVMGTCAPGGSFAVPPPPGPAPSPPRSPICTNHRFQNVLCFWLEGTPQVGVPFTLAIDVFFRNDEDDPPITLTIFAPHTLEVLGVEAPHPYRVETNRPVGIVDPLLNMSFVEEEAYTVPGTRITLDLGHFPVGRRWLPPSQKEVRGDRVQVRLRVREAGEWQVHALLRVPYRIPELQDGRSTGRILEKERRIWQGILGWSTETEAHWTEFYAASRRARALEGQQCGDLHCTFRFPYDPYQYALGLPAALPGRSLRERPTVFCDTYEQPGTCSDYGLEEGFSPEEREVIERLAEECREKYPRPPESAPPSEQEAREQKVSECFNAAWEAWNWQRRQTPP